MSHTMAVVSEIINLHFDQTALDTIRTRSIACVVSQLVALIDARL
jgi:hypothetical protein